MNEGNAIKVGDKFRHIQRGETVTVVRVGCPAIGLPNYHIDYTWDDDSGAGCVTETEFLARFAYVNSAAPGLTEHATESEPVDAVVRRLTEFNAELQGKNDELRTALHNAGKVYAEWNKANAKLCEQLKDAQDELARAKDDLSKALVRAADAESSKLKALDAAHSFDLIKKDVQQYIADVSDVGGYHPETFDEASAKLSVGFAMESRALMIATVIRVCK